MENMEEKLMQDAARAYEGLQHINAAMTRDNVAIVFDTLQVLQNIHIYLGQIAAEKRKQAEAEKAADIHVVEPEPEEAPAEDEAEETEEEPEAADNDE